MPKPTPMPEIEEGDWVLEDDDEHTPYIARPGHWSFNDTEILAAICEIRKADGRIWRREEP